VDLPYSSVVRESSRPPASGTSPGSVSSQRNMIRAVYVPAYPIERQVTRLDGGFGVDAADDLFLNLVPFQSVGEWVTCPRRAPLRSRPVGSSANRSGPWRSFRFY